MMLRTTLLDAMRMSEQRGDLIAGADGVVEFLKEYFHHTGAGNTELAEYFATWSPYRIRRVHVKLFGAGAVYRPEQQLKGITGTRDTYLFVGVNAGPEDRATTTRRGRDGSVPDVIEKDWALAMGTDKGRLDETKLTVKLARTYVPRSPAWKRGGAAGEESRDDGDGGEGGNGDETGTGQEADSGGVKRGGRKRKMNVRFTDAGDEKEAEKEAEKEEEKEERENRWGGGGSPVLDAAAGRGGRLRYFELARSMRRRRGRRRRRRRRKRRGSRRSRSKKKKRRKRRG